MKKTFNAYAIGWAAVLGLFNVIVFVTPNLFGRGSKYDAMFWVSYALITLTFIGQLGCAYFAFQADSLQKSFYNFSLIKASAGALVAMLVAGSVCMIVDPIPNWVGIIACSVALAFGVVSVAKATVAIDAVTAVDQKIKAKTFFIKALMVDVQALLDETKNQELRAVTGKVYEALRYSDPMSNPGLENLEEKIADAFEELAKAVRDEDVGMAQCVCKTMLDLIGARNDMCKALK